ncbi:MAG: NO-inducible flavohemoprotein [Verrucomicrobia bacterium]|nr:NO-inducible flavohemoprotein [Verrucomicrobiota bacterium]
MTKLTPETIATVKATIPFLSENSVKLTCEFYHRMFRENPEVKEFFNPAHQASGAQQGALAGAVCAFARNIDTPENLASAVSLIAHKHVSLGVQPEHYPIVGKHLLGAIDALLDPAPPEILEAWGQAYGFLAEVLTGAEAGLFADKPWEGFKPFRIARKVVESESIASFYLEAEDGNPAPAFLPGQYLTVRIPAADGTTTMRNYSLSSYGNNDFLRISVKREEGGHASNYLHGELTEGGLLDVAAPSGDFVFDFERGDAPVLLLSGGVGVTPILGMLHANAGKGCRVDFVHGAINGASHAFKEEVDALVEKHENLNRHYRYSEPAEGDEPDSTGFFDLALIEGLLKPDTEVYFCGPKPMMSLVHSALNELGHPAERIHFEFFGPQEELLQCPMH